MESSLLRGHTCPVTTIAFSRDGSLLATGSEDNTIRIWDTTTKFCKHILVGHTDKIDMLAFSFCGKYLASCGDRLTIRVWNTETGRMIQCLYNENGLISLLMFTAETYPRLIAWRGRDLTMVFDLIHESPVTENGDNLGLTINSPRPLATDGHYAAKIEGENEIVLYDQTEHKIIEVLFVLPGDLTTYAISFDKSHIALIENERIVVRRLNGAIIWKSKKTLRSYGHITATQDPLVYIYHEGNRFHIANARERNLSEQYHCISRTNELAVSPTRNLLALPGKRKDASEDKRKRHALNTFAVELIQLDRTQPTHERMSTEDLFRC